jgi:hypothetical protein
MQNSPKSSTTKVVMANEAVFTFSKMLLVHQAILYLSTMMDLSLQSGDIPAASKHWKKVTSNIQLSATEIGRALKSKDLCQL